MARISETGKGIFSKHRDRSGRHQLAKAASVMKHMNTGRQKPERLEERTINPDSEEGRKIQEELAAKFPELGIKLR
ncbi:MAG: hypothetical protein AAGB32_03860 [Pseudomonadota bacterium]